MTSEFTQNLMKSLGYMDTFCCSAIKVVELMAEVTTQLVQPGKEPLRYPCIIFYSFEHCAHDYLKKVEV
jgi:hypothetical protein